VEILLPNGKQETLLTSGPLDAAPGLGNYVEALFKKGSAEFDVCFSSSKCYASFDDFHV
jgi:hypothetical protein